MVHCQAVTRGRRGQQAGRGNVGRRQYEAVCTWYNRCRPPAMGGIETPVGDLRNGGGDRTGHRWDNKGNSAIGNWQLTIRVIANSALSAPVYGAERSTLRLPGPSPILARASPGTQPVALPTRPSRWQPAPVPCTVRTRGRALGFGTFPHSTETLVAIGSTDRSTHVKGGRGQWPTRRSRTGSRPRRQL